MAKKVVFIMGAGHCGSTLLDLILGSHTEAFSLGELNMLHRVIDGTEVVHPRICGVCVGTCKFWDQQASLPIIRTFFSQQNRFRSALRKAARYISNSYRFIFYWSGKSILIDSSKNQGWIKYQLKPAYTWRGVTPYLIYLCRDGRAVVNSYLRKYPERGIVDITNDWKQRITKMNRFYEQYPEERKIRVRYEELATRSEEVIQWLCSFLGLKYENDMLSYWKHEHHVIGGNLGARSLLYQQRKKYETGSSSYWARINKGDKYYVQKYYEGVGLSIKLDLRWQRELTDDQLLIFESIAGELNVSFAYESETNTLGKGIQSKI